MVVQGVQVFGFLKGGIICPRIVKLDDELNLPTVPPFELEDKSTLLIRSRCDLVLRSSGKQG